MPISIKGIPRHTVVVKVSVIIPTYCDTDKLISCLEALARQSACRADFEVIVVDNHDTPTITQCDILIFPQARIIHQPTGGSYAARNLGIEKAQGDILLFTDADCLPAKSWISRAIELQEQGVVGGHVELVSKGDFSDLELYERIFYFNQKAYIQEDRYAVTANLMVTKSIMNEVGLFDASLRSGGDRIWGQLATSKGFSISYDPKLKVLHPTRSQWRAFLKRRVRVLSGNLYLFHREVGLTWEHALTKMRFIGGMNNFKKWTGDWDFYDQLSEEKKQKIRRLHRVFSLFDLLVILRCKLSFKTMKKLTLIDRNANG